jgi:hypothetical protein
VKFPSLKHDLLFICFILILFIMLAVLFHFDKLILGSDGLIRNHDTFDNEFSRFISLAQSIRSGGLSYWLPHISGGMPSYAHNTTPYYLIVLLLLAEIPSYIIYQSATVILMAGAGFGMYLLLNRICKLSTVFALFGGTVFALTSQFQGGLALISLPLNFLFPLFIVVVDQGLNINHSRTARFVFGCIATLVLLIAYPVSSIPYYSVLTLLLLSSYTTHTRLSLSRILISCLLIWVGFFLISAPNIYALLSYIPFSQRVYEPGISLSEFVKAYPFSFFYHGIYLCRNWFLAPVVIGLIPVLFVSSKLRHILLISIIPFSLGIFFSLPTPTFLEGTIFQFADLDHFIYYGLPVFLIMFVCVGLNVLCNRSSNRLLWCFVVAGLLSLLFLPWSGHVPRDRTIIYCNALVLLAAFQLCLYAKPTSLNRITKNHIFYTSSFVGLLWLIYLVVTFKVFKLFHYFLSVIQHPSVNGLVQIGHDRFLLVLVASIGIVALTIIYRGHNKHLHFTNVNSIVFIWIWFILLIPLISLSKGLESNFVDTPYSQYYGHSLLDKLGETKPQRPFRVASLYTQVGLIQNYGLEGVDFGSPLSPLKYKELLGEIVGPQLVNKYVQEEFVNNWYSVPLIHDGGSELAQRRSDSQIKSIITTLLEDDIEPSHTNVSKAIKTSGLDIILNSPISDYLNEFRVNNCTRPEFTGKETTLADQLLWPLLLMMNTQYVVTPYCDDFLSSISTSVQKSIRYAKHNRFSKLSESLERYADPISDTLYIYKLENTFPRAYFVSKWKSFSNDINVLRALSKSSLTELKNSVFVRLPEPVSMEGTESSNPSGLIATIQPEILLYSSDKIKLRLTTTEPGYIVISNTFHPNWNATLNGEKSTIVRANHAFQGIKVVRAGEQNLTLEYRDNVLSATHLLIPIGVLLLFIPFFYRGRNRFRKPVSG